jgi:hypothetical protein
LALTRAIEALRHFRGCQRTKGNRNGLQRITPNQEGTETADWKFTRRRLKEIAKCPEESESKGKERIRQMSKIGRGNGSVSHPGTVNGRPAKANDAGKVSRIGQQYVKVAGAPEPKLKPFSSGVPLGNEAAKTGGKLTVYGQCGSQGVHGPSAPGPARQTGSDPWRGK